MIPAKLGRSFTLEMSRAPPLINTRTTGKFQEASNVQHDFPDIHKSQEKDEPRRNALISARFRDNGAAATTVSHKSRELNKPKRFSIF
jgi:hypothetical protein